MQKKASILFYSLVLLLMASIISMGLISLFNIQVETLIITRESIIADYAALSGVEHTRNIIFNKNLNSAICDGSRKSRNVPLVYFKTHALDSYDTRYWGEYSFICHYTLAGNPPYQIQHFFLKEYEITSTGAFGGATRTVIFNWVAP